MSNNIMITGGLGFIGSNFARYLAQNRPESNITIYDAMTYAGRKENIQGIEDKVNLIIANILDRSALDKAMEDQDIVFHMAAESHVGKSIYEPDEFIQTDFVGTFNVLESAKKAEVEKLICFSTSEVYGTAESIPMTEEHPLNARSPYAAAKAGADRMAQAYYYTYDLPITIVRPFNNYGANQHPEKVIPRFIILALKNEKLTIEGSGEQTRDWLYVDDHCEVLHKLISYNGKGELINLGTGKDVSVLEIAKMILLNLGKSPDELVYEEERMGNVMRHVSSTDKAEKLLGWSARTSFEDGLKKTIQWYQENEWWWKPLVQ